MKITPSINLNKMPNEFIFDVEKPSSQFSKENILQNSEETDLVKVADKFEALFLQKILQQARDSKLSDGLFENSSDDDFVEMLDRELANSTSNTVDIGIADAIVRQLTQFVGKDKK
jgi:Rod binding domain-containing protein